MKHVFDSPDKVAHLWAHGIQDSARYRDNFYFQDRMIFSYGEHFLCGYRFADGVFGVTTASYGPTTGKHIRKTDYATFGQVYQVPSLTALVGRYHGNALKAIADTLEDSSASKRRNPKVIEARRTFTDWLALNWHHCNAESLQFLFDGLGYTEKQRDSMQLRLERERERAAAQAEKGERNSMLGSGKHYAAMPIADIIAALPDDESPRKQDRALTELRRLHKAASGAGREKQKRALWARIDAVKAHIAGRGSRLIAMTRSLIAQEIVDWRANGRTGDRLAVKSNNAFGERGI